MARYHVRAFHTSGKHGSATVTYPDPVHGGENQTVAAQRTLADKYPPTNSDGWTITTWTPKDGATTA